MTYVVTLTLPLCKHGKAEVAFLSHTISASGICPLTCIEAVRTFPVLRTRKHCTSCLASWSTTNASYPVVFRLMASTPGPDCRQFYKNDQYSTKLKFLVRGRDVSVPSRQHRYMHNHESIQLCYRHRTWVVHWGTRETYLPWNFHNNTDHKPLSKKACPAHRRGWFMKRHPVRQETSPPPLPSRTLSRLSQDCVVQCNASMAAMMPAYPWTPYCYPRLCAAAR